jgi:hypothetical protein
MSIKAIPPGIRVIHIISNIAFWFFTAGFVLVSSVFIFYLFDSGEETNDFDFILPAHVNMAERGIFEIDEQEIQIQIVNAQAYIRFNNAPNKMIIFIILYSYPMIGTVVFILFVFKRFLTNVKKGLIFDIRNIKLLKIISYGLLAYWVLSLISYQIGYFYVEDIIKIPGVELTNSFDISLPVLFVAAFIWVLSHVFIAGIKLQEENELTI